MKKWNMKAARRFFKNAISKYTCPIRVTIDKSGANKKAIDSFNIGFSRFKLITIRQNKYLNNRIEQNHQFIKKRVRAMLGFKSFRSAKIILSGIELRCIWWEKSNLIYGVEGFRRIIVSIGWLRQRFHHIISSLVS